MKIINEFHLESPFLQAFQGRFVGVLRWEQLDNLWKTLADQAEQGWYVYAVGEPPPTQPLTAPHLREVITELDALLRRDHNQDYCGIVYTDSVTEPSLIKVYDPHQLGSVCGSSGAPVLPGWVLSRLVPVDLPAALPQPGNRRRWWEKLLGNFG